MRAPEHSPTISRSGLPGVRASSPPPSAEPATLAAELEHTKRVLATKLADLRTFQTERETLLARISERDARIQRLEADGIADVPRMRTRVIDLESELTVARTEAARATHLDAELSALRAQHRRLEASADERVARVVAVELELAERQARVAELESRLAATAASLAEREAKVRALETELAESLEWAPAPQDDLTKIKGIGPKFRDALASAGVTTYAQIAGWTDADVAEIAVKLRIQPNRVAREGWVDAAGALVAQGQRLGSSPGTSR